MLHLHRTPGIFLLLICVACGATSQGFKHSGAPRLRDIPRLHMVVRTSASATSIVSNSSVSADASVRGDGGNAFATGNAVGDGNVRVSRDDAQAELAGRDLAFELGTIGFQLVDRAESADVVAYLSVGRIRYDPITGWIADEGYLEVVNAASGVTLYGVRARPRFVTPTVETIVAELAHGVRKYW